MTAANATGWAPAGQASGARPSAHGRGRTRRRNEPYTSPAPDNRPASGPPGPAPAPPPSAAVAASSGGGLPARSRTLIIWCPDWPAVAAARNAGHPTEGAVAVFHANRVQACSAAARADGVRTGMRRRDAQSRSPGLAALPADADRDARLFEPVAAAVEAIVPGIEVLRPGMLACALRGPARYFGSETAAAERLVDAVEALDVECRIGIADVLPVAVLAARQSVIIPPGGDAVFCARLPIVELARDPAIASPERMQLVDLLMRLGITTAGAFAALPFDKVAARFGAEGMVLHRLASGRAERGLSRRHIDTDLSVEKVCDPPLERVDTAAFVARALAEQFHAGLAAAGLACTRLAITASTERGARLTRIWRGARPLSAAATADRLRWQLDGWLTNGSRVGAGDADRAVGAGRVDASHIDDVGSGHIDTADPSDRPGAITKLRLEPIEAVGAGLIQYGLWGQDGEGEHRAGWAFARVQGLLGPDAVLAATPSGGRGPADRVTLTGWGEERIPRRDPTAPWPGVLPSPAPASHLRAGGGAAAGNVASGATVTVSDPAGREVAVTDRGMLTGPPAAVGGNRVLSWAGPWLLDERWWSGPVTAPAARTARMQVIADGMSPMLLGFGSRGWQVEAVYD